MQHNKTLNPTKSRVESLDYLRGMAALSILSFHFSTWIFGELHPQSFLGKMGIYGVSIFYVLSGLTLYHVYKDQLAKGVDILIFFLKRIFRIYPLLILVTTLNMFFGSAPKTIWLYIKNITGVFGFIDPSGYIATGAWSIGNELVFYSFFPFILILFRKNKYLFSLVLLVMLVLAVYFCFFYINSQSLLSIEWRKYVNPFNQIYLFFAGVVIGMIKRYILIVKYFYLGVITLLAVFWLYPIDKEIELITGITRITLSIIMCVICLAFYLSDLKFNKIVHKILIFFGDISYSIYLLHPITYAFLIKFNVIKGNSYVFLLINILAAVLISSISYFYIEKVFVKMGSRISKRIKYS